MINNNYIEERPWGKFEILVDSDYCKVKRITVNPGGRLSYQYHYHRSEVWIIVAGTATITLDDEINWYDTAAIPEFSNILMPIASILVIVGFNYRRRH